MFSTVSGVVISSMSRSCPTFVLSDFSDRANPSLALGINSSMNTDSASEHKGNFGAESPIFSRLMRSVTILTAVSDVLYKWFPLSEPQMTSVLFMDWILSPYLLIFERLDDKIVPSGCSSDG